MLTYVNNNAPATLSVTVQLTVFVPVPAVALTNDAVIASAVQNVQNTVTNAFCKQQTALVTVQASTLKVNNDVYDLV